MSRACKVVGDISTSTPVLAFKHGDENMGDTVETFYTIPCELYTVTVPLLISEHKLDIIQEGHVQVTGSLMSVYKRKHVPKFYFFTNDIVPVEPDVMCTNTVSFTGRITVIPPQHLDDAGRDVATLTLSDMSPLGDTSILYVVLRDALARQLSRLKKEMKICGEGYLKPYRDTFEIYAKNVKIL